MALLLMNFELSIAMVLCTARPLKNTDSPPPRPNCGVFIPNATVLYFTSLTDVAILSSKVQFINEYIASLLSVPLLHIELFTTPGLQ